MTCHNIELSNKNLSRTTGLGYLIIILAGITAEFFVRSQLIVWGDPSATATNITVSEGLYRFGITLDMIMLVFDLLVGVALYFLLKPVSRTLALLSLMFRIVHTAVNGINLLNMIVPILIIGGADYFSVFNNEQLNALIMLFLNSHNYGYLIALVFFAFHCFILGYLIIKSGFIPKILGLLMILASLGYLIDSFAHFLMTNYNDYASIFLIIVALPAIIAELSLALWLLFKGVK